MPKLVVISAPTGWGIIGIGLLAGLLWVLPDYFQYQIYPMLYFRTAVIAVCSVLAFAAVSFRSLSSWMAALVVLPFIALMTGWWHWNFPDEETNLRSILSILISCLMLFFSMPFLQVWCSKERDEFNGRVIAAFWQNSFTLLVAGVVIGQFWLVMLLCISLFELVNIDILDFFLLQDLIFPVLIAITIAVSIVLSRRGIINHCQFRHLFISLVRLFQPVCAVAIILFLILLPWTRRIVFDPDSGILLLLLILSSGMMFATAVTCTSNQAEPEHKLWLQLLIITGRVLSPVLALIMMYLLWLKVNHEGWHPGCVYIAVAGAVTLCWTMATLWYQRRAWFEGGGDLSALSSAIAGIMALCWLLLHCPVIDPFRITVNSQLLRFQHGYKATEGDLYMFSQLGRRGRQLLDKLAHHPGWLSDPVRLKVTLTDIRRAQEFSLHQVDIKSLQGKVFLHKGSHEPPETWWQSFVRNDYPMAYSCLDEENACLVWMMELGMDSQPEVLLYNRMESEIRIYARQDDDWQQEGYISLPTGWPKRFELAMKNDSLTTVVKELRDLQIGRQRYPIHFYYNPKKDLQEFIDPENISNSKK